MNALSTTPVSSKLAKPLGQGSLSSSLATALKVARVLLSIACAIAVIAAAFGIPLSILVATHVVSPKVLNGPGYNMLGTWTFALPTLVYSVIATCGALIIVRRLQSVFASLVANDPFARGNAAHLRSIWVTLVVIEISRIMGFVLAHGLAAVFLPSITAPFPRQFDDPIDLVRLFVIFVVLILAEVFRQGTQLREETEFTV
jgi:Protein of unknown function (DUF2975)